MAEAPMVRTGSTVAWNFCRRDRAIPPLRLATRWRRRSARLPSVFASARWCPAECRQRPLRASWPPEE